jgi:hypothetical protein
MRQTKTTETGERASFYGNVVLSWYGVGIFGPIVFYIWQAKEAYKNARLGWSGVAALSVILLFPLIFSYPLFYFTLSDDSLEIKHHIFRWYRKEYPFKNIELLTINKAGYRIPQSLSVKCIGSRARLIFAGSLRDEDWYDFAKALKKKGIPLDNNLW